jgi:hypothetical protein
MVTRRLAQIPARDSDAQGDAMTSARTWLVESDPFQWENQKWMEQDHRNTCAAEPLLKPWHLGSEK